MTYSRSRRYVPSVELMPLRLTPGSTPMDPVLPLESTYITTTTNPMDPVMLVSANSTT